jgi:hypothetical protein
LPIHPVFRVIFPNFLEKKTFYPTLMLYFCLLNGISRTFSVTQSPKCHPDIDGGLSAFLIDLWHHNNFRWNFGKKNQDGGGIKVGQKSLFLAQKFKK